MVTRVLSGATGVATGTTSGPGGVGGAAAFLRRDSELSASSGDGAARAGDPIAPSESLKPKAVKSKSKKIHGIKAIKRKNLTS